MSNSYQYMLRLANCNATLINQKRSLSTFSSSLLFASRRKKGISSSLLLLHQRPIPTARAGFINSTSHPTIITSFSSLPNNNNAQQHRQPPFHEKVTQRLLDTKIGTLNQASIFELTTAISSWHSQAMKNSTDTYAFYKSCALFNRLLDEFMDSFEIVKQEEEEEQKEEGHTNKILINRRREDNVHIKIEVETLNLVLDSWRVINNTRWNKGGKINRQSVGPDEISFANHGRELLTKCSSLALKYNDKSIQNDDSHNNVDESYISHPDAKSFNIVLDGYSKLGMVDETKDLFQMMQTLSSSSSSPNPYFQKQSQCRPDKISYNTLLFAHANVNTRQFQNAQSAAGILEDMIQLYNATNDIDLKPDAISFSIVISAFANASPYSQDAPYQAEHIFDTMNEMYRSSLVENGGDEEWIDLKPNHMCYTSLISAWSRSRSPEAVDRSAAIMASMQMQKDGDGYYHLSGLEDDRMMMDVDGEQAENVMNKMLSMSESSTIKGDEHDSRMPSTITFVALLDGLAQSAGRKVGGDGGEAALRCENIIKKMEDLYESGNNDRIRPNTPIYNALINAWAKSKREDAGEKAEEWLEIMKEKHLSGYGSVSDVDNGGSSGSSVKPDKISFSSTIMAYANVNNGKDAERIFMQMYEAYENGEADCKPNVISFSAVINAYANRGEPEEAERLLGMMNDLQHLDGFELDQYCLNCVLKAYIKSNHKDSTKMTLKFLEKMDAQGMSDSVAYASVMEKLSKAGNRWAEEKGEKLLANMWDLYDRGNGRIKPTATVYNSLINLLAKSNNPKVSRKSVDVLNDLQSRYDISKDPDLMPNTVTFNSTLSAFSKASNKHDVKQAESIVEQMEELYNQGYNDVKPDSFTLTNLISCYAYSNMKGSAERAEEILQQMQEMYDEHGDKSMKPTKASFGAVLNAWAREGNAQRAQAIVDHMETLQDSYGEEMSANHVIYNTLINSWSKSGSVESGKKAQEILTKMQELCENGKKEVCPSRITYNSVLAAYHKSGDKHTFTKANKILQQMENSEDPSILPDVVTYTTFLNIVSKWKNNLKIDTAEEVLEKMMKRGIIPNNFTYDAVLRTCVMANPRARQVRRKALVLAVKTLNTMQQSSQIIPTSYTYSLFFSAISKLSDGNEQKKLLHHTFQDCCKEGLVTDSILDGLKQKFEPTLIKNILFPSGNVKEISIQNLPEDWSRHSHQKLPTATSQRQTVRSQHHTGRRKVNRR